VTARSSPFGPCCQTNPNTEEWRPGATEDEIVAAARLAQADGFIRSLPGGYDTILDRGEALSGGQKQHLAIARAILMNAPILMLDEATAYLDPDGQHEIQQALDALAKGRTVIAIAHRLSSVRAFDRIVYL
jgi:ABC-type multidrug transport system fused ATPase/permease subunit